MELLQKQTERAISKLNRGISGQDWPIGVLVIGLIGAILSGCSSEQADNFAARSQHSSAPVLVQDQTPSLAQSATPGQHNWPVFGGGGLWSTTATQLPTQWDEQQGIAWVAELPGRGASSPIVSDERLFLTSFTGYGMDAAEPGDYRNLRHHLLSFDANTGRVIWQREIVPTALRQEMNPNLARHGFASSTPVTDGKRVFAWFGASGLFAFDVSGDLLWQRNLGLGTKHFGSSASPLLHDNFVIVNASIESNTIYALEKATGAVCWQIHDVNECWSFPVIGKSSSGENELIVSAKNIVAGYDPATGVELWHCSGIQDYVVSVPVIVDGVCYLTGGKEKQMMAIRLGGKGDVEKSHKLWETKQIGANVSSPVIFGNRIFVFHDSGILQVINIANGDLVKRQRTATKAQPFATPLLVGRFLYVPFQDAGVAIYTADDDCREVAINKPLDNSPLNASIAAGINRAWVRSDRQLYCIGNESGPAVKFPWVQPENNQEIIARQVYNLDPSKGRARPYLLVLTPDPEQIALHVLMPYQSVITDEQTTRAREIVFENKEKYQVLLQRYQDTREQNLLAPAASDQDFDARYRELDAETEKLNSMVRVLIKKLFSAEQMKKHTEDAAVGRAHIKPSAK